MRIGILTGRQTFPDAYSLTGVIRDQATALTRHGHDVTLYASDAGVLDTSTLQCEYFNEVDVECVVPDLECEIRYASSGEITTAHAIVSEQLAALLSQLHKNVDVFITHDWIAAGRYLPYAEGLKRYAAAYPDTRFLHWVHSTPAAALDWLNYSRYSENHHLVWPNRTDAQYIARRFSAPLESVRVIPHIVDYRTRTNVSRTTWAILDKLPGLVSATFTQVYPVSRERLQDKGVDAVIYTFAELKRRNFSVCLLVVDADPHGEAGNEEARDLVEHYERLAERNGLHVGRDFAFSSSIFPAESLSGLPRSVINDLYAHSNLFVYPTRGESFGLVLPEAALMGGVLPVLNRSLSPMLEIAQSHGLYFQFGSDERQDRPADERAFFEHVADHIVARATSDDVLTYRTAVRRHYNVDAVYQRYYRPALTEIMERT